MKGRIKFRNLRDLRPKRGPHAHVPERRSPATLASLAEGVPDFGIISRVNLGKMGRFRPSEGLRIGGPYRADSPKRLADSSRIRAHATTESPSTHSTASWAPAPEGP